MFPLRGYIAMEGRFVGGIIAKDTVPANGAISTLSRPDPKRQHERRAFLELTAE
jgi:hypothetical protein